MLSNVILRWIDFLKSNPKSARLGLFLCIVTLALIASRINITENIYNVLPDGEKFESFQKLTRNKDVLFSISFPDSLPEENLALIANGFAAAIDSAFADELSDISLNAPSIDPMDVIDHYTQYLYAYLSTDQLQRQLGGLNADSIKKKIRLNHNRLFTWEAGYAKNLVFLDPLGLSSLKLKELQSYSEASPVHEEGGVLVLNNRRALLVRATANFEISDLQQAAAFQEKLSLLIAEFENRNTRVDCFAGFLIAAANSEQVKADTWLTVSITIIFIILLLLVFYRNLWAPLYFLLPGILGILFSLAMMALLRKEISAIALGAGAAVIGIVLDYSFHFFTHFKYGKSITSTITTITAPLLTSCLTTVLAFGVLLFTDTSILQDFGLFASLSLAGTAVSILCILPVFLDDSTFANHKAYLLPSPQPKRWMKRLVLVIIGIVTFLAAREAPNISFDSNLENLNYFPQNLKTAELDLLGLDSERDRRIYLLARGATKDEAQRNNYALYKVLQDESLDGVVTNIMSTAKFQLPSSKLYERVESWNIIWKEFRDKQRLNGVLDSLESELGYTDDAFDRFKGRLEVDPNIEAPPPFPLIPELTRLLVDSMEEWTYLTYVHIAKGKEDQFHTTIDGKDGIVVLDPNNIARGIFKMVQADFNFIVLASALLVIITLLLVYGRIELMLITILPMIVGWVWIMGMASYFDLRFNLVNIIVTTFIFGLGDDYAIFITDGHLRQYRFGKQTLDIYRTSIILSGVTTLLGTGVLILAKHPAIQSIAFISVVGMAAIIFLSLTLQPILLRGFIFGRAVKGKTPLTLISFMLSVFAFSYFLLGCLITLSLQLIFRLVPFGQMQLRLVFSHVLRLFTGSLVYIMVNLKKRYYDMNNLDFDRPSIIICNHQSFVDILVMMMLSPKVILLINDWVYNSPFFGLAVRYAGYLKASDAINNIDSVQKKVSEGYSIVIFPEGARSTDDRIRRYHKGAFLLAEQLQLDITPVLLHGIGYAMAKGDFLLKNTTISVKALPRIKYDDSRYGTNYKERAKNISRYIKDEYQELNNVLNDSCYLRLRVLNNFLYKTPVVEWYARIKWMLEHVHYDHYHTLCSTEGKIYDLGCGYGFLAFYLSYRAPKRELIAIDYDEKKIALASNCFDKPSRLNFQYNDILEVSIKEADTIFINDVLHYLKRESQEQLLERCYSNLNPGGKMIISEGVSDQGKGHNVTKRIENWSTRFLRFNKTSNKLHFIEQQFIRGFAQRHQMNVEIVVQSTRMSNVLFILSK